MGREGELPMTFSLFFLGENKINVKIDIGGNIETPCYEKRIPNSDYHAWF